MSKNEFSFTPHRSVNDVIAEEHESGIREMRETTAALGGKTVGWFAEAIYGERMAEKMRMRIGEDMWNKDMNDVDLKSRNTASGDFIFGLGSDQLDVMPERANPEQFENDGLMEGFAHLAEATEQEERLALEEYLADMSDEELRVMTDIASKLSGKKG